MTNKQLVKKYEKLQKKALKLTDWFCNNKMGDLKVSDMRNMSVPHPNILEYLDILDILSELKNEAERRYGPGFRTVWSLS